MAKNVNTILNYSVLFIISFFYTFATKLNIMKNTILSLLIISFALTSCSIQNTFIKRKYTKGIFIEKIADHPTVQKKLIKTEDNINQMVALSFEKKDIDNLPLNNLSTFHKTFDDKQYIAQSTIKNIKNNTSNFIKNKHILSSSSLYNAAKKIPLNNNNKTFSQNISKTSIATANTASDDDQIIQIILAILPILCLIAIYLHDGKTITTNFWIDLILHFLFLLPAVIFALLVVLDVINLK